MIFNLEMGGGVAEAYAIIHVEYPAGSTLTCTKGSTILTAEDTNGAFNFLIPEAGGWLVQAIDGTEMTSQLVTISSQYEAVSVTLAYRIIPQITYTGTYEIVDDNDQVISDLAAYKGNWKIRFLTSGDLTITNPYGFNGNADVFLVGGGGAGGQLSGGGGGNTVTEQKSLNANTTYSIVIGAGGTAGGNGGSSTAFGVTANGGIGGDSTSNGGSGGGIYKGASGANNGGSDGGNGANATSAKGVGQGTTTREFGESSGKLYAGGGGAGGTDGTNYVKGSGGAGGGGDSGYGGNAESGLMANAGTTGETNTGGGGGASNKSGATKMAGGSGIVIIRNRR